MVGQSPNSVYSEPKATDITYLVQNQILATTTKIGKAKFSIQSHKIFLTINTIQDTWQQE